MIWAVLFKNELSNHQLVLSLRITEHEVPKWSNSLQPGTVLGGLRHVVWGQISLKSRGTKDIHQFQTVTLCMTAAARPQTVLGTGRYRVREAVSLRVLI